MANVIDGGLRFAGYLQPPDVPADPTGDDWRGLTGATGATGPSGPSGPSGAATGSVTATGGTTARTLADRAADLINAKDFEAAGDGATGDTDALLAAQAARVNGAPVLLPNGTYKTTFDADTSGMVLSGPGRLLDSAARPRAPFYASMVAAPASSVGNNGDFFNWPSKDISHVQFPVEHWITGAATLGQPATGYLWTLEACPYLTWFNNTSGWNQSTSRNDGRTGVAVNKIIAQHTGGGDVIAYSPEVLVGGSRSGATSFLASPAGSMLGGDVGALNAGVYLQGIGDINLSDNNFDVAGIGLTINFLRQNSTGALGATWIGTRFQSNGAQPIDAFLSISGKATIGFDFVPMTSGSAAITMSSVQRIYGNSTNTDGTRFPQFTAPGAESFGYETANGWTTKVGSATVFGVTSNVVSAPIGNVQVGANSLAAEAHIDLNAVSGQAKTAYFRTAGVARWQAGADGSAEGGANAGCDFRISRFSDAGAFIDTPLQLSRKFGVVIMSAGAQIYGATSTIDQASIGATTPGTGKFTTLTATSALTLAAPVTVTASTYTVLGTDCTLVLNPSAGQTLTLGTATAGRVLHLKLISAFAVSAASSIVVPQAGGAAGTAILSATAGKWATLQGDGTNWQILQSN